MTGIHRLCTCFLALAFAVTANGKEFKSGEPIDLKPDEGLVAVDIEVVGWISSAKIDDVGSLFGGTTLTELHSGTNVRLIALPAGEYRWARMNMSPWYLNVRDDPRFHFKVEAGVVNYAGDFAIAPTGMGLRYNLVVVNRAARMMVDLDNNFPGVRRKFSMRYQGSSPDRFPQFAADELGEQSSVDALNAGVANTLKEAPKDTPPELRPLVDELFARPQVEAVRLNPHGDLVAMIEYRAGKHRVSLLDTQSMMAVDVYRGDTDVRRVDFAGDRTLLFSLDVANARNLIQAGIAI